MSLFPDPHNLLLRQIDEARSDRQKKDLFSRINIYADWLKGIDGDVLQPDLNAFRDYLAHERGLSLATQNAYTDTLRALYRKLLESQEVQTLLRDRLAPTTDPEAIAL